MIEISNLQKTYQMGSIEVPALRGVSLTIEDGEFVAIMGPSGSGKSTLLHILGLLDVPDAGSYQLNQQEISGLQENELADLRGREVGFVFQQFNLLPRTSALENVELPLIYRAGPYDSSYPQELLEKVGLQDRIFHKPNELSGGQQQRVAIARALVNRPRLILADEPTGNLDSKSEEEILGLLQQLNQQGITVIMVTHESEVAALAKRIIRMRDGLIESDVKTEKVSTPSIPPLLPQKSESEPPRQILSGFEFREITQHFKQAFRALFANKIRSALSLLGILIGVAALIATMALGRGAKESIEARLSSLGTNLLTLRPGSARTGSISLEAGTVTRLTLEDAQEIQTDIPEVKRVAPTVNGRAQIVFGGNNWNTRVLGTTSDYAEMRASKPTYGRFFTEDEDRSRERVALLGPTVVREVFGELNPVGEMVLINRVSFQIIGILPEKGSSGFRDEDDVVVIPLQTAMKRLLGKDYVDTIDIEVRNPQDLLNVQEQVKELVLRRHRLPVTDDQSFQVRNMAELQEALSSTSRVLSRLLAAIAAISLLVGGIGIMNIMLVSVAERTREIGLRKALGARARDILGQFLIESIVVSLVGGMMGIVLGWGITVIMSHWGGWLANVTSSSILLAVLFSGGVGMVFGIWPARRASLLNPIEALRYE